MHEALITDLARLGGFKRLIARSAVMRYQDTDQPLSQIAQELGVDAVITGSVLREGDRVRITAQLINAATEEYLWADRYEREFRGVGDAHWTLATIMAYYQWDWASAEREYRRAIELNPNHAGTSYSMMLVGIGRPEEGRAEIERVIQLDPYNSTFQGFLGLQLYHTRQYDAAIAQFRKTLRAAPNVAFAHADLGGALHEKGMYAEAREEMQKFLALFGYPEAANALVSKEVDYSRALTFAAEALASSSPVHPFYIALLYSHAGAKEKTLEWLEQAYVERQTDMFLLGVAPFFDSLRDDPRFQDLMRRVNLPL